MAEIELTSFEECLQNLMTALEASNHEEAKEQLKDLHPGEIALLLEAIKTKGPDCYLARHRGLYSG